MGKWKGFRHLCTLMNRKCCRPLCVSARSCSVRFRLNLLFTPNHVFNFVTCLPELDSLYCHCFRSFPFFSR
ncbi:hypothetical protein Peur_048297 [Populus x canadensis]